MEQTLNYSIAYKGLKNSMHDFHFKVDGRLFEAFGNEEIKGCDCRIDIVMDRAETRLTLDVKIGGWVECECDRCLELCRIPVDFDGRLVVKFSGEAHEYDGEVLWLSPAEDRVDLAQYIYESIVLSLPYQRVHPQGDCNPEMLERFSAMPDGEESEESEERDGEEIEEKSDTK